jgi:LysM repeat protein
MRYFLKYTPFILMLLLFSCSASRRAARTVTTEGSIPSYAVDYLNKYSALAVSEMHRTGIPASITLAQGMLESDYGRSTLARKGNNHFGIKCHNDWNGQRIYHDDNRRGECFRAYLSAEDSFRDHSDFLVAGSRYRDLFSLSSTDYKGWAHGLKRAGYATDPKYPALLIRKIEEYGLHVYDTGKGMTADVHQDQQVTKVQRQATKTLSSVAVNTLSDTLSADSEAQAPVRVVSLNKNRIQENNNVQYIIVEEGDTYESLAEEFQLLSWEISRYNDLPSGARLQPGQIIYLQPKRRRAAPGNTMHTVSEGETMYSLSQKYAVKLSSLYKMNIMEEGTECIPGQKVRIR